MQRMYENNYNNKSKHYLEYVFIWKLTVIIFTDLFNIYM